MKHITSFVLLAAAVANSACVTQPPAPGAEYTNNKADR